MLKDKKKLLKLGLIFSMFSFMLMGCGTTADISINENNERSCITKTYYTNEELGETFAMGGTTKINGKEVTKEDFVKEEYNGKTYYVHTSNEDIEFPETSETIECEVDKTHVYYPLYVEDTELNMISSVMEFYKLNITLPYEIIDTNCELSEDKHTITIDFLDTEKEYAYAYTKEYFDTTTPIIEQYYKDKENKLKKKTVSLKVRHANLVDTIVIDGAEYDFKSKIVNDYVTIKLTEGKHTIKLTNSVGTSTYKFLLDGTKPTISGVKNNKTYKGSVTIKFKDNISGIKSIKVDNKSIGNKTKYTIKKKGSHSIVVTDKLGNKSTVKFKIK